MLQKRQKGTNHTLGSLLLSPLGTLRNRRELLRKDCLSHQQFLLVSWYHKCKVSGVARRKKILVVEDNEDGRELLAKFINCLGYDSIEADSGREAIRKALEMQPDIILMDNYLPDITGDKITRRLKANPTTRDIPVIITTALLERSARNRALDAGAVEILEKPFGIPKVREVLERHLTKPTDLSSVQKRLCQSA